MDTKLLEDLAAVARTGSLSRAATVWLVRQSTPMSTD